MQPVSAFRYTFTVFTPTYNRAHTLHRAYESLALQTFRDFEWLIVDDGSTDTTSALVERWSGEAGFPIKYIQQPNRGKHIAHNAAVQEADGALFLTLDSDDACVPHALERLAALRIYFVDDESSLSQGPVRAPGKHACGRRLHYARVLTADMQYFRFAPGELLKTAVQPAAVLLWWRDRWRS